MKLENVTEYAVHSTVLDGVHYTRFSDKDWWELKGDSMEQVMFPEELEKAFTEYQHEMRFQS